MTHRTRASVCGAVPALVLVLLGLAVPAGAASPIIEITNVPPWGTTQNLGGRVLNAAPADYRVVVLIYVPGAGWWSKPFCNPQLTAIDANGTWSADVTTGGADTTATRMTALLVRPQYSEPCVQGSAEIPGGVTAQAVATASVERPDPGVRRIRFSGYDWWVKNTPERAGPGPNYFSDATNNVWTDALGQLHLRISNRSNRWYCAEIVSDRSFGYGNYRFELGSVVDTLDANAVLGLFTWSDDPAYAHREIDIECSRWGNAADPSNAQYVVQPWDIAGHLRRIRVPPGSPVATTHLFVWETNRIRFQSLRGAYSPQPAPSSVITNWTYALAIPRPGDENVRLNLWLNNGSAPAGNAEVEFIIRSFRFVPLGDPAPATLTNAAYLPGGRFEFMVHGEKDRRYQVQNSTNLKDWRDVESVLATADSFGFVDTNASAETSFYRTITSP